MFKYKIKVVGWEYHILYKKTTFDFWKKTGLTYNTKTEAEIICQLINGEY